VIIVSHIVRLTLQAMAIKRQAGSAHYRDRALTPVSDDDETLDLITKTRGGKAAVAHAKRVDELTHGKRADQLTAPARRGEAAAVETAAE
jgi:hypothetical protein